jgi:MoxR-like ATPase
MATSDNMADTGDKIFVGKGEQPAWLTLALANRHGLVTGATGTGKTVSLQVMAEGSRGPAFRFSRPTSRETCRASPKSASPRILS